MCYKSKWLGHHQCNVDQSIGAKERLMSVVADALSADASIKYTYLLPGRITITVLLFNRD